MKYYKLLRTNRSSWYDDGFIWPLNKPVEIKEARKGDACGIGLHLAKTIDDCFLYGEFPCRIFEAEPISPILGEDNIKIRVAKAKLGKEVTPQYVRRVNSFIRSLEKIPWMQHARPPLKKWKLFETREDAWKAAENWGWDAACDVAWNAARDAARIAARNAARDAARIAALFAARRTLAGDAGGDVGWDAALWASMLVCDGLKLDEKYIQHARARMEVWRRGYGLLCDIDGVLYVYKEV